MRSCFSKTLIAVAFAAEETTVQVQDMGNGKPFGYRFGHDKTQPLGGVFSTKNLGKPAPIPEQGAFTRPWGR